MQVFDVMNDRRGYVRSFNCYEKDLHAAEDGKKIAKAVGKRFFLTYTLQKKYHENNYIMFLWKN